MRCLSALLLLRDFDQFFFLVLIFICNACYKRCSATSQVRKLESTAFRIPLVPQELRCRFQVMNEEGAEPAADGRDGTVLALPASSTLRLRCVWILWSPPPPWLQALTDIPASPVRGQSLSLAFTVLWAQLWQQGIGWHVFTQQIFVEHVRSNDN